jgi:type IV pilus assembly protein PilX
MMFEYAHLHLGKQRGMTLVVCLVFLLLLTLIGISSMQNATLQEKMAGSVVLRNGSFQMAEAMLRIGENTVKLPAYTLTFCSTAATCAPPSNAATIGTAGYTAANGVVWVKSGDGYYAIQRIGTTNNPAVIASGLPINTTQKYYELYRITGVGIQGTSRTVLESIYAKQQ